MLPVRIQYKYSADNREIVVVVAVGNDDFLVCISDYFHTKAGHNPFQHTLPLPHQLSAVPVFHAV